MASEESKPLLRHQLEPSQTKVLVGLSGGPKSAVVAALLKNQGYQVVGAHVVLSDPEDDELCKFASRCSAGNSLQNVKDVSDKIDIRFSTVDAKEEFKDKVIDYCVHEFVALKVPNPCIVCNAGIKFKYLFRRAEELGCDFVATGHFALVRYEPMTGLSRMYRASDASQDQSYFLYNLSRENLARTMMPLGGLSRDLVRKLAISFDFDDSEIVENDNSEICFIKNKTRNDFIESRSSKDLRKTGMVRRTDGTVVGEHQGFYRHVIGDTEGYDYPSKDKKKTFYVVEYDMKKMELVLSADENDLFHDKLQAVDVNWVSPVDGLHGMKCAAKISPDAEPAACNITLFENETIHVEFEKPQRAITLGASIVFYREDEILGGGKIHSLIRPVEEEEKKDAKKTTSPTQSAPPA